MKGKVIVDNHIKNLCHQVEKLTEILNQLISANEKISSKLIIENNVNINLEKQHVALKKLQFRAEHCDRRNNMEITGIPKEVLDKDQNVTLIGICKDSNINVGPSDIEGCHCLPLGINNANNNKLVLLEFLNGKRSVGTYAKVKERY